MRPHPEKVAGLCFSEPPQPPGLPGSTDTGRGRSVLRGLRWRPSPGRRGSARPLQRHMLKGSTASTGGQHRDTHFQGVLTTPAAPGGPGCSHVHVSQHGTTLRSHGLQAAATSSVSSFRPLCSLGWGTVACPAVLSLAGPSRTPSGRIARMHRPHSSPHCAGSRPGSPRSPSPPTRTFRRRRTQASLRLC